MATLRPPRPSRRDRRLLEALCLLRALYARRGPQDTTVVISVGEAIATAEMQLRAQRGRDQHVLRRFIGG